MYALKLVINIDMKTENKFYKLNQIVKYVSNDNKITGNKNVKISNAKTPNEGNQNSIVFIGKEKKNRKELLIKTKAGVIVCDYSVDFNDVDLLNKCLILTDNPRLTFSNIVNNLFVKEIKPNIHKTAVIGEQAIIGNNCFIGPNTYVGDVTIGNNCRIYGNCYIYNNTTIGENVIIHANSVIGSDGFGYFKNNDGSYTKFPQLGGVIINDNVEIGSNTSIARGALGNTIIGKGTKIDNLVHIAHNVTIGTCCIITAGVVISGSVTIGNNVWLSPSVVILNNVNIGDNSFVGSNSLVIKKISKDSRVFGNPAIKFPSPINK